MRVLSGFLALFATSAFAQAVDPPTVPATGEQIVRLRVPTAGRYALQVKSPHGVALRLEDRLTGALGQAGTAGSVDGRLDVLLDAGEYRLRLFGPPKGAGDAAVTVLPFAPTGPTDEVLEDGALITGTLADRQSREAWIQVTEAGTLWVEVAGRALADVRVWKDGQWLVDTQPHCQVRAARPGEPRNHCSLSPLVKPGWYRVVAYGGPGQTWTQAAADADAVFLRRGLTELSTGGARRVVVGPFGVERFRVRTGLHQVRWTQPETTPSRLGVGLYDVSQPLRPALTQAAITAQSRAPVADYQGFTQDALITVEAVPGQVGTLRWLRTDGSRIQEPGPWFATLVHTGGPDDLPITAQWVATTQGVETAGPGARVTLGPAGLAQRFNLAGEAEVFLTVEQAGTYTFALDGGRLRVEPWWTRSPPNYAQPALQPSVTLPLGPGTWRLTLSPDTAGQVGLLVTGQGSEPAPAPLALRWDRLDVPENTTFSLHLPRTPGISVALVARKLPVELGPGLPVRLAPGETLLLPIQPAVGRVVATDQDGRRLPIALGAPIFQESVAAPRGGALIVRNDREVWAQVEVRALPLAATGEPPRLTAAQKAQLPDFPEISVDAPQALDLESGADATFKLRVDAPGLYVAESTGLLSTTGTLRTSVRPQVALDRGSGTGRNFAVARTLKAGDYQLSVFSHGASAGHIGLRLRRTEVIEAGPLRAGRTARRVVPANTAAVYDFEVPESKEETQTQFHIHSTGAGTTLRCRLEDAEGYPEFETSCSLTRALAPGRYRLVLLPERLDTTRLTTIKSLAVVKREGPGPHALPFDEVVEHTWQEPAAGAPRAPHVWTFTIQGPTPVSLSVSAAVVGELKGPFALRLPPGRTWTGPLPKGDYRLEITAAHPDDGARYALELRPHHLIAGGERDTSRYDDVTFSVGEPGTYALSTTGANDVRLTVRDAQGRVVGEADDSPDDWNARLTLSLQPGEYRTHVEGGGDTSTRLHLQYQQPERVTAPVAERTLPPGGLEIPWEGQSPLAVVRVEASEHVAVAFESQVSEGWNMQPWQVLAEDQGRAPQVAVRPGGGAHRVRVWSLEDAGLPVRITFESPTPTEATEAALAAGIEAKGAISIGFSAGVLELGQVPEGAWACPAQGQACRRAQVGLLPVDHPMFLATGRLKAARTRLGSEPTTVMVAGPTTLDLAPGQGPRWIEASTPEGRPSLILADHPTGEGRQAVAVLDLPGVATPMRLDTDGPPLAVRLKTRGLTVLPEITQPTAWAGELPPGSLQIFKLTGEHALRVVLGRGAALRTAHHLAWADTATQVEDVPRAAGLMLANPTDAPVPVRFELGPSQAEPEPLKALKPFEFLPHRAGTLRLPVPRALGVLRVAGAEGYFRRADGRRLPADGAAVGEGGELTLRHGRAPVLAWVQEPTQLGPWPAVEGPAEPVGGPMSLPLAGPRRLAVALPGPAMLSLYAPAGTAIEALPTEGMAATTLDGRLDVWLPQGRGEVTVRPSGTGSLEIDVLEAIELADGVGPTHLFAPGESRLYHFITHRTAPVGVGIQGEVDRLRATLRNPRGSVLAEGGTFMPTLEPGTWLLTLHLPEDAPAAAARPTLLGVAPPPDGPPAEVAAAYRRGAPEAYEAPESETWQPWIWSGDVPEEVPEDTEGTEGTEDTEDSEASPGDVEVDTTEEGTDDPDAGEDHRLEDTETDAAPAPGDEPEAPEAPENTEENE